MSEDEVCKVMRTFTFQPLFFSVSIRGLYLVCLCAMANFEYFVIICELYELDCVGRGGKYWHWTISGCS